MSIRVRQRNESAWLLPNDGSRTNHRLRRDMRRFDDADEIDLVIVGCGAGGSVMLQRLARAGWRVAALDAGPFWDPDTDWFSDEAASHHLYWTEPRVITGTAARRPATGAGPRKTTAARRPAADAGPAGGDHDDGGCGGSRTGPGCSAASTCSVTRPARSWWSRRRADTSLFHPG